MAKADTSLLYVLLGAAGLLGIYAYTRKKGALPVPPAASITTGGAVVPSPGIGPGVSPSIAPPIAPSTLQPGEVPVGGVQPFYPVLPPTVPSPVEPIRISDRGMMIDAPIPTVPSPVEPTAQIGECTPWKTYPWPRPKEGYFPAVPHCSPPQETEFSGGFYRCCPPGKKGSPPDVPIKCLRGQRPVQVPRTRKCLTRYLPGAKGGCEGYEAIYECVPFFNKPVADGSAATSCPANAERGADGECHCKPGFIQQPIFWAVGPEGQQKPKEAYFGRCVKAEPQTPQTPQVIRLGPEANRSTYPACVPGNKQFVVLPCPPGSGRACTRMAKKCPEGQTLYPLWQCGSCGAKK